MIWVDNSWYILIWYDLIIYEYFLDIVWSYMIIYDHINYEHIWTDMYRIRIHVRMFETLICLGTLPFQPPKAEANQNEIPPLQDASAPAGEAVKSWCEGFRVLEALSNTKARYMIWEYMMRWYELIWVDNSWYILIWYDLIIYEYFLDIVWSYMIIYDHINYEHIWTDMYRIRIHVRMFETLICLGTLPFQPPKAEANQNEIPPLQDASAPAGEAVKSWCEGFRVLEALSNTKARYMIWEYMRIYEMIWSYMIKSTMNISELTCTESGSMFETLICLGTLLFQPPKAEVRQDEIPPPTDAPAAVEEAAGKSFFEGLRMCEAFLKQNGSKRQDNARYMIWIDMTIFVNIWYDHIWSQHILNILELRCTESGSMFETLICLGTLSLQPPKAEGKQDEIPPPADAPALESCCWMLLRIFQVLSMLKALSNTKTRDRNRMEKDGKGMKWFDMNWIELIWNEYIWIYEYIWCELIRPQHIRTDMYRIRIHVRNTDLSRNSFFSASKGRSEARWDPATYRCSCGCGRGRWGVFFWGLEDVRGFFKQDSKTYEYIWFELIWSFRISTYLFFSHQRQKGSKMRSRHLQMLLRWKVVVANFSGFEYVKGVVKHKTKRYEMKWYELNWIDMNWIELIWYELFENIWIYMMRVDLISTYLELRCTESGSMFETLICLGTLPFQPPKAEGKQDEIPPPTDAPAAVEEAAGKSFFEGPEDVRCFFNQDSKTYEYIWFELIWSFRISTYLADIYRIRIHFRNTDLSRNSSFSASKGRSEARWDPATYRCSCGCGRGRWEVFFWGLEDVRGFFKQDSKTMQDIWILLKSYEFLWILMIWIDMII